ncbi:MAG: ribulose 1,5-bisphosphate carboxylase large subunit [Vampirovibrionales bacterium]|nr:ribulose 1,5-bisphosphate carboxylase large subunit [Vampirovibrionales bacterium]
MTTLSGERFQVAYRLATTSLGAARAWTRAICLEQTVEFPADLLPADWIAQELVGREESLTPAGEGAFIATVSYPIETVGGELPQLLNVLLGNISLQPGVRALRMDAPESLLNAFRGPRLGCGGLRALLGVWDRPLLFTAVKPMGLSASELADRVYQMALGGVDVIKDDHGLANQAFAPYRERVARCAEAVQKANRLTGAQALYAPNITGPFDQLRERAQWAKSMGAGGILICPALSGFDAMRALADDDALSLAIFSHPAFLGNFLTSAESGIAHGALLGQIMRLAGADAVVYPNFGGRFSFTRAQCEEIAREAAAPMGALKPIFPCPGGGMTLDRIPELKAMYGRDVMFLVGGDIVRHSPDLTANCRYFRSVVESGAL